LKKELPQQYECWRMKNVADKKIMRKGDNFPRTSCFANDGATSFHSQALRQRRRRGREKSGGRMDLHWCGPLQ